MFLNLSHTVNPLAAAYNFSNANTIFIVIAYLLLMSFKQECEMPQTPGSENISIEDDHQATCSNSDNNPQTGRFYVRGLVSLLGGRLKKYWRIGVHWLIAVKNYLLEPFNDNIVQNLADS